MLSDYLLAHHKDDLINILHDEDDSKHFSINIKLDRLLQEDSSIANKLLREFDSLATECKQSVISAQQIILDKLEDVNVIVKNNVHIRLYNFPPCPELVKTILPKNQDVGLFMEISGTIIRTTIPKILEFKRNYECTKCKEVIVVYADFEQKYLIPPPSRCKNSECNGNRFITASSVDRTNSKDYQEVKIQEHILQSSVGLIPNSLWVILEDDLVDSCKPGDNVAICGIVKSRWKIPIAGKKIEVEIVVKANHVFVSNDICAITVITPEIKEYFSLFWRKYKADPLKGRDIIIKSFCPEVYGLFIVKLALMVTLAGGSQFKGVNDTKVKTRSQPHLLLVGDPGTGKSQLLKFAAKVISRSVFTTGIGSTSAGLTVTAVHENGEWQLEAGALVLSDGGICCIDEFNSMKEHDRTSIHEAMEQQTLSVAKASIVCKLNTRCSILAATNPKGNLDSTQNFNTNIGMASPLLSRFDLVFVLKDSISSNWDSVVSDFILNECVDCVVDDKQNIVWDLQMLQAYMISTKKIHPTLTDDTNRILGAYYQFQRRAISRNRARTTVRLLDSLVRLSQGHARLMYHTEVEIVDAVTAVMLIEASMQGDSSMLGLEFDVYSSCPENPRNSYAQLIRTILTKLELFDLLEKELRHLEESKNDLEPDKESQKLEETVLQNSFKNIFRRCNSTTKNIVISKRKSSEDVNGNVKKIKLNLIEDEAQKSQAKQNSISSSYENQSLQTIGNISNTNDTEDIDFQNISTMSSSSECEVLNKTGNKTFLRQFRFKSRFEESTEDNLEDNTESRISRVENDLKTHKNDYYEKQGEGILPTEDIRNQNDEMMKNRANINNSSLNKENDNFQIKVTQKDSTENKLDTNQFSQKTKTRHSLTKFRFIPRDPNLHKNTINSEQIQEKNGSENFQEKEVTRNVKVPGNSHESQNNEIENFPNDISQNTKNKRFINNFCFKSKAQLSEQIYLREKNSPQSRVYSQSIFEEQEDTDLDLEL